MTDFAAAVAAQIVREQERQDALAAEARRVAAESAAVGDRLRHLRALAESYRLDAPPSFEEAVGQVVAVVQDLGGPEDEPDDADADDEDALTDLAPLAVETGRIAELIAAPDLPPTDLPAPVFRSQHLAAVAQLHERKAMGPLRATSPDERVWTEDEDRQLIAMKAEGKSSKDVGDALGWSAKAVDMRIYKLRKRGVPVVLGQPVRRGRPAQVQVKPDEATCSKLEQVAEAPPAPDAPADPAPARVTGDWTAVEDLILVEGLFANRVVGPLMDRLGRSQADCLDRFDALVPDQSRDGMAAALARLRAAVPEPATHEAA